MNAVDQTAKPVQSFDWGVIKWYVTPDDTEGANLTFGEVVLLPGKGHERHNHPDAEEVLYVLAGEGEQMLDDGGENSFPIKAGDTIYVPTAMFHSTVNTGWQPLRLLALYNPGGSEKALRELPDFREGDGPDWSLRLERREPHGPADRDPRHEGRRVRLPARPPARRGRGRAGGRRRQPRGAAHRGRHLARGGGVGHRRRPERAGRGARPRRRGDRDGRRRGRAGQAAARRGPHRRRSGRGRIRQHGDRHPGDAGVARGRAQADGLDDGRGRHARLRGLARRGDDGVGGRRGGHQCRVGARAGQRRGGDGGDGAGAGGRAGRGAPAGGSVDVRRDDAVRDSRARGAGGAWLRAGRVPRHRCGRHGDGGADGVGLPAGSARRHHHRAV